MDIDTGKICRCCLSLNSSMLLSMYQSDSAGGCVASMISSITNLKLQQHDKMPEKVCLSCISEINRCYVFKIKIENSNKTLRQMLMLPDVTMECESSLEKKSARDIETQTDDIPVRSTPSQTQIDASSQSKEVQTEVCISGEETLDDLQFTTYNNIDFCEKINKRRDSSKSFRSEQHFSLISKQHGDNGESYIVVETDSINNESCTSDENKFIVHDTLERSDEDEVIEQNVDTSCFEYSEDMVDDSQQAIEKKPYNIEQNECVDNEDIPNINEQNCDTACGQSEFTPKRLRSFGKRKEQYKCSMCIMTFVSLKVLRRHIANRHSGVGMEDIVPSSASSTHDNHEQENEENSTSSDVGADVHEELTQENVPNPRLLSRTRHSTMLEEQHYSNFKFYCEYCQAGFAQRKTLTYHMKQNCMTSNFKCNQCDRIFISKEKLDEHSLTHKNHPCLECKQVCDSVEELSVHMIEVHNRNARNQCHVCKKVFTMKASLVDHLRVHSGDKPFLCTICGKRFTQNSNLRQHIMRHQNKKDFKCDICPNAYVTKAELFSHKRTHTGETPFKCNFCNASFTSSSSLQKHVRKHTGERPYSCDICPMRFTALNILKNHHRTHTGERPYKCLFCEKSFTQKGDCLLHQRTHEFGDIKCFCGSKFSKITNLRIHVKVKHPNMTDEEIQTINDALKTKYSKEQVEEGSETHVTPMDEAEGDAEEGSETHVILMEGDEEMESPHSIITDEVLANLV
ncbi:uncharacterized protein [Musca autumnalis]|uniref:uncharacterized protein n=1 Tax=Musca autumnalis TaxID=221902 RepID=UPI003CEE97BE